MLKLTILLSLFLISFTIKAAQTTPTTKPAETKSDSKIQPFPTPPKVAKGEYAIFLDDEYKIFKTKTVQDIELATDCFKKDKPDCLAYHISQQKPPPLKFIDETINNLAAVNCADLGGKNLIAFDYEHKEYNFCRFTDGSMADSWSMYFKYHPVPDSKK